jgi:hypothetical protein
MASGVPPPLRLEFLFARKAGMMRVIQLCGVNLAKPSLPAVECQYQTIAWLSANPASANFRFTSTFLTDHGISAQKRKSRPDHNKFRISGGRRNYYMSQPQALIKGIDIAKIHRNVQFQTGCRFRRFQWPSVSVV